MFVEREYLRGRSGSRRRSLLSPAGGVGLFPEPCCLLLHREATGQGLRCPARVGERRRPTGERCPEAGNRRPAMLFSFPEEPDAERSHHAPDGRVDRRGDDHEVVEEGGRARQERRADLRDFDRQGGRGDPGPRRRNAPRDSGPGRSDVRSTPSRCREAGEPRSDAPAADRTRRGRVPAAAAAPPTAAPRAAAPRPRLPCVPRGQARGATSASRSPARGRPDPAVAAAATGSVAPPPPPPGKGTGRVDGRRIRPAVSPLVRKIARTTASPSPDE